MGRKKREDKEGWEEEGKKGKAQGLVETLMEAESQGSPPPPRLLTRE